MSYVDTLTNGTVIGGDYKIIGVLGGGGFANTYLAFDLALQREVAIKEYYPRAFATRSNGNSVQAKSDHLLKDYTWGLNRFTQEAKIIARFRHANVVRIFRVLEEHNTTYIVLEYVAGADLEAWRRQRGQPLTQQELDGLLAGLLSALQLVHQEGVLHRDVKPANIYIRSVDRTPVLLDFGASRFAVSGITGTTAAIVSRGYSPQEAYTTEAEFQGPWTDIYGLAASVYFAISGSAPPEATERVLHDEMVPAVALKGKRYRHTFLDALDWGLRVQPNQRPQSVAQWLPALLQDGASPPAPKPARSDGRATGRWKFFPRFDGRATTADPAPRPASPRMTGSGRLTPEATSARARPMAPRSGPVASLPQSAPLGLGGSLASGTGGQRPATHSRATPSTVIPTQTSARGRPSAAGPMDGTVRPHASMRVAVERGPSGTPGAVPVSPVAVGSLRPPASQPRAQYDSRSSHSSHFPGAANLSATRLVRPTARLRRLGLRFWLIGLVAVVAALLGIGITGLIMGPNMNLSPEALWSALWSSGQAGGASERSQPSYSRSRYESYGSSTTRSSSGGAEPSVTRSRPAPAPEPQRRRYVQPRQTSDPPSSSSQRRAVSQRPPTERPAPYIALPQ